MRNQALPVWSGDTIRDGNCSERYVQVPEAGQAPHVDADHASDGETRARRRESFVRGRPFG